MKKDKSIHQIIKNYQEESIDMPIDEVAVFISKNVNRKTNKNKVIIGLLVLFLGAGILLIKVNNHKKQIALQYPNNKEAKSQFENKIIVVSPINKVESKLKAKHLKQVKASIINENIALDNSMDDLMNLSSIDVSAYNNIDKIESLETDVSAYNNVNMIITN